MVTLVIATRNAHKVGEIRAILGERFHYLTLNDFPGAPKTVEDAGTFQGNAVKKANELAQWLAETRSSKPETRNPIGFVLADDSGLEVDALDGEPGVHSARFAAVDKAGSVNTSDADNNAKLLRLLKDVPADKRTARFRCVVAVMRVGDQGSINKKPDPELFEGTCEGRIGFGPRGQGGFGYDPLFIPSGFEQTFAELGEATKNQLSHRGRALALLRGSLQT
jgi:XTP/dITP diphosphohydrolase